MIKTKCVYDTPEESDGKRILVSRWWPRGKTRQQLKIAQWNRRLAPSKELLKNWKLNKLSWEEYVEQYTSEMTEHADEIAELREKAATKTITLLCFEKEDDPHCHRHILKRLIEKE